MSGPNSPRNSSEGTADMTETKPAMWRYALCSVLCVAAAAVTVWLLLVDRSWWLSLLGVAVTGVCAEGIRRTYREGSA
jgi:hypothetical protein